MSEFQVPSVSLINNRPSTTSLAIAEYFEKRHCDVLRDIQNLVENCPEDFHKRNFALMSRKVKIGNGAEREEPYYVVFFDGFILLVMGYTGPKALKMKLAYIEAFNAMRAKIESRKGIDANQPITLEMQKALQAIIRARLESHEMNAAQFRGWSSQFFIQMNHHFGLRSYKELPQAKLAEAIDFLMKLELPAKKIEAKPEAEQPQKLEAKPMQEEDPELDHDTYQIGKKIFDLLASAKFDLECVTGHMLFLYSGVNAYIGPDKRVLYDNLSDCVKAAGAGLQAAVLNIRSACRIKSRIEFKKR